MKVRLGFALLVMLGLTAFAPAPLPRSARRVQQEDEITLRTFQGRWRVTKVELTTDGGKVIPYLAFRATHVRIAGERWTFMHGGTEGGSRAVTLDQANSPPFLNMSEWPDRSSGIHWAGLIRRQGRTVQVAYRNLNRADRPRSFEDLPRDVLVVTLERD